MKTYILYINSDQPNEAWYPIFISGHSTIDKGMEAMNKENGTGKYDEHRFLTLVEVDIVS